MIIPALIAGAGVLGGGLASYMGAKEAAKAQREGIKSQENMYWDMVQRLEEIGVPSEEATKLALEMYAQPDQLKLPTMGLDAVSKLPPSAMEGVAVDPEMRAAQVSALQKLQGMSESTGLDPIAKAQMEQAFDEAAARERSQRAAIQQGMQRRGMAGSGLEFAGAMGAQQAAADRGRQQALQSSAMAQQRALEALMSGQALAGQLSAQDLALEQDRARAKDAIDRANTAAMQRAKEQNLAAQRESALKNWMTSLDVAQKNVDLRNKMSQYQAQQAQQQFQNELAKAGAINQPMAGIAGAKRDMGQAQAREKGAMWDALGKTATTAGALGYDYYSNQPRQEQPLTVQQQPTIAPRYEGEKMDIFQRQKKTGGMFG